MDRKRAGGPSAVHKAGCLRELKHSVRSGRGPQAGGQRPHPKGGHGGGELSPGRSGEEGDPQCKPGPDPEGSGNL